MSADRIARVETALRAACTKAGADGVTFVAGAFRMYETVRPGRHRVIGCCALGALGMYPAIGQAVTIDGDEYDAIEHGWDDEWRPWIRNERIAPWWALGRRLAAEFKPVPASALEDS